MDWMRSTAPKYVGLSMTIVGQRSALIAIKRPAIVQNSIFNVNLGAAYQFHLCVTINKTAMTTVMKSHVIFLRSLEKIFTKILL